MCARTARGFPREDLVQHIEENRGGEVIPRALRRCSVRGDQSRCANRGPAKEQGR